ncbi:MAG: DUF6266 family protein [Bacteroidales bacterium]|nr:DUF6266 family protein [Bacteroidales bacterium]
MGTIKQGILGGFSGKVGTVIGSSWKGISYMKGRAQSVKNPKTAAQTMQRNYFKQLAALAAQLSDDQIHALFPRSVKGMTPRNLLLRQLDACAVISDDVKSVDLSLLEGIGNGDKINSPMLEKQIEDCGDIGLPMLSVVLTADELAAIGKPDAANFILVAYNTTKSEITIINTDLASAEYDTPILTPKSWEVGDVVRGYLTYAASGEDVSMRGFGSFIIKTRTVKKGRNNTKNEPDKGSGDDGDNVYSINPVVPRNDERPVVNNDGDGDGNTPTPSSSHDLDY